MSAALSRPFEALWRVREVAEFLRVSTSWVYKAAERGDLPSVRLGANLRFLPESIRDFVAGKAFEASTAGPAEDRSLTCSQQSDLKSTDGLDL
jgi:excisionase family DNA binding protein